MATTQANPTATLEVRKSVFDLESKDYVTLVKQGEFSPVDSVENFVARMGNDASAILAVINDGLAKFEEKKLADSETPWKQVTEDGEGNEVISDFNGSPISEEKGKQLSALVIMFAKTLFGYKRDMDADEKKNRELKKAAKEKALAALLTNPATLEGLKG